MEDVPSQPYADSIVAMDLFVVPTISFRLLYGLLIMGHGRRQILWVGATKARDAAANVSVKTGKNIFASAATYFFDSSPVSAASCSIHSRRLRRMLWSLILKNEFNNRLSSMCSFGGSSPFSVVKLPPA